MMLPDGVDVETELVGQLGLLDHLPQPLTRRDFRVGDLRERGQSELHVVLLVGRSLLS